MTGFSELQCRTVRGALSCVALIAACSTNKPATPVLFNGTFHGNEAESKMLPGQHVPTDFVGVMKDDGVVLQTIQTFKTPDGQEVRYVWSGVCDGELRPVQGATGGARLGCVRTKRGELIITLADDHGYRHVETCTMSRNGLRETCLGTASLPDGSKHNFVYVFDRK